MGLKEQQSALAKLYTSNSLREQLANSALRQEASLDLSQAEQSKLKAIVNGDITAFAVSLITKRLGVVKKILPGTCALLAENLSNLFKAFAVEKPTTGVKRHLIDARNFTNYLVESRTNNFFTLNEHKAVLEYEKAWVNSELSALVLKAKCFKHDISSYTAQLGMREKDSAYTGKPRVCIWLRLNSRQRLLYWELFPRFWPR
jgi:hypothetical protein